MLKISLKSLCKVPKVYFWYAAKGCGYMVI